MEGVLTALFEEACKHYPGLFNKIKVALVEEFMEHNEEITLTAVSNVVDAELGWLFTQDRAYDKVLADVREKVSTVRANEVSSTAAGASGHPVPPSHLAEAVGDVPLAFIQNMVARTDAKDEATHDTQVGTRLRL